MRRRDTLAWAAGGLYLAAPASAQGLIRPVRLGVLSPADRAATEGTVRSYTRYLADGGWLEGRDYTWAVRHTDDPARLPALAAELMALKPALVFAPGQAAPAAVRANAQVPVLGMGDLVSAGVAQSLQRPGGRVTGVSIMFEPLNFKRMELLAGLLPRGSRVLVLAEHVFRQRQGYLDELLASTRRLGHEGEVAFAGNATEVEAAFRAAARRRLAGVNQLNSPTLWGLCQVSFRLSLDLRLPAIYQFADAAADGGLMGYGPRRELMLRQLVRIALRVLAGEDPAQIPIEQPAEIQLTLNRKVAEKVGLKFPAALLARADEVIE